jgi:hypothetical protein
MSTYSDINCPISEERVNENVVRTVALLVFLLVSLSLYLNSCYISGFLAIDFATRAFTNGKWSILRFIALQLNQLLKIKPVSIDAAPKKFAAGLGIIFSIAIACLQYFQLPIAAFAIGAILLICAFLECVLSFCVGCLVYTLVTKLLIKPHQ